MLFYIDATALSKYINQKEDTSMTETYHLFLAQLDGCTYRCSPTLDDTAFDLRMNALVVYPGSNRTIQRRSNLLY